MLALNPLPHSNDLTLQRFEELMRSDEELDRIATITRQILDRLRSGHDVNRLQHLTAGCPTGESETPRAF